MIVADDYCEAEQGVAAARKLIADGVVFVAGHLCSGAAIPASALYQEAGIVMIAPSATNPKLTEQGFSNVFRVVKRDSEQAKLAGDYLAEHWADAKIAILHDGTVYGQGLAEETRRQLNRRGIKETQFGEIVPGQPEYTETVAALEAAGIEVLFYGGYTAEAALIARHAHERDYDLQLLGSDNLNSEYFLRVAGPAVEGVRFVSMADPRIMRRRRRSSPSFARRDTSPKASRCTGTPWFRSGRRRSIRRAHSMLLLWSRCCATTNLIRFSAGWALTTRAT